MGLDFNALSPQELLAAESAVLVMRSLMQAVKVAPHGQGMACVESALHDKGFEHLRTVLTAALASHDEAQKKTGGAVAPAPAAKPPRSNDASPRTS